MYESTASSYCSKRGRDCVNGQISLGVLDLICVKHLLSPSGYDTLNES